MSFRSASVLYAGSVPPKHPAPHEDLLKMVKWEDEHPREAIQHYISAAQYSWLLSGGDGRSDEWMQKPCVCVSDKLLFADPSIYGELVALGYVVRKSTTPVVHPNHVVYWNAAARP